MANKTEIFCDLCEARQLSKPGEVYCPLCDETLFSDCRDNHKFSKATKSHQTITIQQYSKLPSSIRSVNQFCAEHGDIVDFYCPVHDSLCCKRCITSNHSECKGTMVLEDLLKTSSSSTTVDGLQITLQDVQTNIRAAIKNREENLKDLERHKLAIAKLVEEKRAAINSHLDKLETDLLQKLSATENENKKQIGKLITAMEKVLNKAEEYKTNIDLLRRYGSGIQIFITTRELLEPISCQEKFTQSVYEDGSLYNTEMEFVVNEQLERFLKEIKSLGGIKSKHKETSIKPSWQGQVVAQTTCHKTHNFGNIQPQLVRKIDINGYSITGCVIWKAENTLFSTGTASTVLKYDGIGVCTSELKVSDTEAFDIALMDDDTVIVTGGGVGQHLHFIDTTTLQAQRVIEPASYWSYGATVHDGALVSCTHHNIVKFKIKKEGFDSECLLHDLDASYTYITSDTNYIYHSNCKTDSVTCYSFDGETIWTYTDDLLREPKGITLDSHSNIYVAGSKSNNVVVISPIGKRARQLLGSSDGLDNPCAIYYDKESDRLLVSNKQGPAFLYTML